jgi:putative tryptophan/tyrosine transport system substrate-binding protein
MGIDFGRRQFISILGGASFAWPLAARAQQPATPVIGFLSSRSAGESTYLVAAFRQGLRDAGYVEGKNIAIEFRWAEGKYDQLPALAADLAKNRVAAIAATGGAASGLAAKAATTTIPIVFTAGDDPIAAGLVTSLNRPTGNVTGVSVLANQLGAKRLELLHELVPAAKAIGYLVNTTNPSSQNELQDIKLAATSLGLVLHLLKASSAGDIDAAFATLGEYRAGALIVGVDPFFNSQRDQLIALAARDALPVIYSYREFAAEGGLMSYAPSLVDGYRQTGVYTGRILKGEKPADLPVIQPTKFQLVINLKAAKALGLTVPQTLLVAADEVIE